MSPSGDGSHRAYRQRLPYPCDARPLAGQMPAGVVHRLHDRFPAIGAGGARIRRPPIRLFSVTTRWQARRGRVMTAFLSGDLTGLEGFGIAAPLWRRRGPPPADAASCMAARPERRRPRRHRCRRLSVLRPRGPLPREVPPHSPYLLPCCGAPPVAPVSSAPAKACSASAAAGPRC